MDLFAYGTLLVPRVLEAVTGRQFERQDAVLANYARHGIAGHSYPALTPEAEARTEGALYLDVDATSWERLDAFEGSEYERVVVDVIAGGDRCNASTYVLRPEHRHRVTDVDWDLDRFVAHDLIRFLGQA